MSTPAVPPPSTTTSKSGTWSSFPVMASAHPMMTAAGCGGRREARIAPRRTPEVPWLVPPRSLVGGERGTPGKPAPGVPKADEHRQNGYRHTMRSMWKGAISFGLVMIPVKLYAATEQRDVTFRQVHREDGGRIKFRRFCSIDGEEVPFADVAKGYELPDGEMVILTDDDLADLPLPTAHSIEVVNFTPAEQLDTILANRAYYTEPEPAGVRAYALLRDALERSGKVAIARVALRQRESLASLRTRDGVMVLETLLWPDEVR